jgi:2-hydroxychromene-2-carboxylate isomerase
MADVAFYFDLADPECYLASERVPQLFRRPLEWVPVLASRATAGGRPVARSNIERRGGELGLPPLRWPAPCPFDSEQAMLAATYAKGIGRAVAFAQAAFRQAFAAGRSLADIDNVLIAAAACELHPAALLAGMQLSGVSTQLAGASATAREAGVTRLPSLRIGDRVFAGEPSLEEAAALAADVFAQPAGALAR